MNILIADDDRAARSLLEFYLKRWAHNVRSTSNGAEAWKALLEAPYSLVISDWVMPELDGVELIRKIRSHQFPDYVYSILLTSRSQREDLITGLDGGADEYLTKPFDVHELQVRLRAAERVIRLEQSLAQQNEQLKTANCQMRQDLQAAALVQRSLLPPAAPVFPGVRFAWMCNPCNELGGDFLNVFRLDDAHVGFYLLDVSGHGVPAALLSVTLSHILFPAHDGSSLFEGALTARATCLAAPSQVLEKLNRQFPMAQNAWRYFTIFYGILDLQSRELRYASAGHPSAVLLSARSEPRLLKSSGPAIGAFEVAEFLEHSIRLRHGDRLLVYSDGVTEAMDRYETLYSLQRLVDTARRQSGEPLGQVVTNIVNSARSWCGIPGMTDDMSCLALELDDKIDGARPTIDAVDSEAYSVRPAAETFSGRSLAAR